MFSFNLQPNEIVIGVGIDFAELLDSETISTYTVSDGGKGIVMGSWIDGTKILMGVKGNRLSNQNVKVTITVTGSSGSSREGEIVFIIKEK
jgi:hypothetical protein